MDGIWPADGSETKIVTGVDGKQFTGRFTRPRPAKVMFERIYHGDELLTEVPRTTGKNVARFKVRKPEPPRCRNDPIDSAGQLP